METYVPPIHILVIEDDPDILELIEYNLLRAGFKVSTCGSGSKGLALVAELLPDLVLLDIMLPDIDGLSICKGMRANQITTEIPVVMLTARTEEADVVTGLDAGADDYITKPFSPKVLVARLQAVLRRRLEQADRHMSVIRLNNIVIDPGRHETTIDGERIDLTATEFRLLYLLAGKPGWVFSRDQIVDSVRGDDVVVTDRSVDVHIAGLRRKMGEAGRYIETVRGSGYRFGG